MQRTPRAAHQAYKQVPCDAVRNKTPGNKMDSLFDHALATPHMAAETVARHEHVVVASLARAADIQACSHPSLHRYAHGILHGRSKSATTRAPRIRFLCQLVLHVRRSWRHGWSHMHRVRLGCVYLHSPRAYTPCGLSHSRMMHRCPANGRRATKFHS